MPATRIATGRTPTGALFGLWRRATRDSGRGVGRTRFTSGHSPSGAIPRGRSDGLRPGVRRIPLLPLPAGGGAPNAPIFDFQWIRASGPTPERLQIALVRQRRRPARALRPSRRRRLPPLPDRCERGWTAPRRSGPRAWSRSPMATTPTGGSRRFGLAGDGNVWHWARAEGRQRRAGPLRVTSSRSTPRA